MTYESALNKIHSLLTFGSRPGLDRMRTLLERLGNPQDRLQYIHVAGTNGKGSVCAMLSGVLAAAGYKTGLFISPYITDFRERIQINNALIGKEVLTEAVENTFPIVEELRENGVIITEFEYVNALEFYIHANAGCDIVVLETGMGGLLDCTNVIRPPLCSVITTIGLDHTAVLGDTVEKIAEQKCGIIKPHSIAVTSAQCGAAMSVIEQTAKELHIPLIKSESVQLEILSQALTGSVLKYRNREITLSLAGSHQVENAKTALAALEALNERGLITVGAGDIADGLANAVNPARLELLRESPIVLLDGAHNPNGIEALKEAIQTFLPETKIICVTGMLTDKDIDSSIALLQGVFESVYTVPVNNPRAISPTELAAKFSRACADTRSFDSAENAFVAALARAKQENLAVLICGSLYLAGEIRSVALRKLSFRPSEARGEIS